MKALNIGLAAFLLGLTASNLLHAKTDSNVIQAKKIEIVDANGKPRIILQTGPEDGGSEPSIVLMGAHGKANLLLSSSYPLWKKAPPGEDLGIGIFYRAKNGDLMKLVR